MKYTLKKAAAVAMVLSVLTAPAYAATAKIADGELFVNERITAQGRVLYKAQDAHSDWEHDSELAVPGLVCASYVNEKGFLDAKEELVGVKKLTTREEKIKAAQAKYTGKGYEHSLILFAAMDTQGKNGNLAITKAELFGRLLNVTVAIQDGDALLDDGSETISRESAVAIPMKQLPRFGNLRVRFVDATGHGLDDMDVALER